MSTLIPIERFLLQQLVDHAYLLACEIHTEKPLVPGAEAAILETLDRMELNYQIAPSQEYVQLFDLSVEEMRQENFAKEAKHESY